MKLLVFAHVPPPHHGQSFMVAQLLAGLAGTPGLEVHHVNARLSADAADIGRARPGKLAALARHLAAARRLQRDHGLDTLYYVPAPGKRGALVRDWLVMAALRPRFRRLVLHWHAAGLGDWLAARATPPERALTRRLLGNADLSIVLGESLRADAEFLGAKTIGVVPNGIPDPGPPSAAPAAPPWQVLFLGLGSEEKGLFAAAAAVLAANAGATAPRFALTAAGSFPDDSSAARFAGLALAHPGVLRHLGFVEGAAKAALLAQCHCLALPTRYPHEAMPLVVLEALAHDRPVLATRWRGLADVVTPATGMLVPPGDPAALADALLALAARPPAPGVCRAHFLRQGTRELWLEKMRPALAGLT